MNLHTLNPTICLNMIVKNESHIIIKTLNNLCSYINFSYWVICDTGSTDNTKELITDFFKKKKIDGEIVEHKWKDFGYNRSQALKSAYNKTDFVFIFDADDEIIGDFKLPTIYDCDKYTLNFGKGFVYVRPLLFNNRKKFCFKGVLHEYLSNIDEVSGEKNITGDYHVVSGRTGDRSKNTNKYIDDANILKKAHYEEEKTDYNLSCRYAFYCAQSFKDSGPQYIDDAIEWYKKCLDLNMWAQEKYHSCFTLGDLYMSKKDIVNALKYWYKTIEYDFERIEGIVNAVTFLRNDGQNLLVNALYHKFKNYNKKPQGKLFLFQNLYEDELEYQNVISAFYVNDKESGYECCKKILINKILPYNLIKSTITNLIFYLDLLKEDTNNDVLQLFYSFDSMVSDISNKNETIEENIIKIWNALFEKNKSKLVKFSNYSFENRDNPKILLTFTTCKRFDLFKQTVNSMLNHWTDIDKVEYWFCVDDNSSDKDRNNMKISYPWINYYNKTMEEKGHRKSMNIIWDKLNELKPMYWIHIEDDFLFHNKMNYIEEAINAMNSELCTSNNVKQVLFNRNYGEITESYNTGGHIINNEYSNIVLHKFVNGTFPYQNCHYWPHYSFRPSLIDVKTILELGNFDSVNQFFEIDYANKWSNAGYSSAFFNKITNRHIGRLTSDRGTKNVKNAYDLNDENQFSKDEEIKSNEEIKENEETKEIINISNNINIKIVNLERRPDRKEETIKKLESAGINYIEFIKAVDGSTLKPTQEIFDLFKGNDFGSRKGFIGCALSHYNLWKQLLDDKNNEYYLIMEDDFSLCANFKNKLESLNNELISRECLFLGYHMFEKKRQDVKNIYDNDLSTIINVNQLDKNLYIGGYFAYSINKIGAKKMIDYIQNNGIKHGIDYLNKIINNLESYECQPHLVFSEWNEANKKIDSDIQNTYEYFDFSNIKNDKNDKNDDKNDEKNGMNNIYINGISGLGNNLFQIAVGIYYKETYNNCNIFLNKNSTTLSEGTGNKFGKNKLKTSYFNTILSKFNTVFRVPKCDEIIYNDCYSLNKIDISNTTNTDILIDGYSQNSDLIFDIKEKLLNYFNLDDINITTPLLEKYKINNEAINVMLGIRIGTDGGFKYSKFTKQSYKKVIDTIVNSNSDKIINIYVLSDVENISIMVDNSDKYNVIYVNEDDISQIYIGLMCNYFILSDSTYHWWIAFLKWTKDPSASVYVFNDTDITKRCLLNQTLKTEWKYVDLVPNDNFIFIKNLDHFSDDIHFSYGSVPVLMDCAEKNDMCAGFNTLGFFKNKINLDNLKSSPYFGENDGLYIKKEYYDSLQNIKKHTIEKIYENDIKIMNDVFIETGAYMGDGIQAAINLGFKEIHSIELAEKYYNICKEKFKNYSYVHLHLGDSGIVLPNLIKNIKKGITFWLDGHYSSLDTACANDYCSPIEFELMSIKTHYHKDHVILIDDMKDFTQESIDWNNAVNKKCGYITKKKLEEIIQDIYSNYNLYYFGPACVSYNSSKNTSINKNKIIRVKMLCNWCSSEQLCKEWSNMCEEGFVWKNIELVWTDKREEIDYYVIINFPPKDAYFDPLKTIVFQMEPWVNDATKNWGVKTWGEWSILNPDKFLSVFSHKTNLNNVQWQINIPLNQLKKSIDFDIKQDCVSCICSSKNYDEGHISRNNLIKYIEENEINIHVYGRQNYHDFKSYVGPLLDDNKFNGFSSYKYCFNVENNSEHNYATEKLWEPILCESLCFYYGCPNVTDYIDSKAFVLLDINDFEKSYQIIKQSIEEDLWSQRINIIRQEKQRILNELAFFPTIQKIFNKNIKNEEYKKYFGNNTTESKKYCFIHSCNVKESGTEILTDIVSNIINSGLIQHLEKIFIVNIGENLEENMFSQEKIKIINYSDNYKLCEIPTINLIHTFCEHNPSCEILYLHTKGSTFYNKPNKQCITDWRNMMLYFLVEKHTDCFEILKKYDATGCNYITTPFKNHFSGNFWWANSNYIKQLKKLPDICDRHEAEWWILSNKLAKSYEIHNSSVNHYIENYPKDKYIKLF